MMKLHLLSTSFIIATVFALTTSLDLSSLTSVKFTTETQLIIQNLRYSPVESVIIEKVDPFDFEAGSGPEEKFKGLSIPARRSVQRRLDVNTFASRAPLQLKLIFNDGTTGTFHINMKYAIGEKEAEFRYEAPFNISFKRVGNTIVIVLTEK